MNGVQADHAVEAAIQFLAEVTRIRSVIDAQQAAQELTAKLRTTELRASDDLQVR